MMKSQFEEKYIEFDQESQQQNIKNEIAHTDYNCIKFTLFVVLNYIYIFGKYTSIVALHVLHAQYVSHENNSFLKIGRIITGMLAISFCIFEITSSYKCTTGMCYFSFLGFSIVSFDYKCKYDTSHKRTSSELKWYSACNPDLTRGKNFKRWAYDVISSVVFVTALLLYILTKYGLSEDAATTIGVNSPFAFYVILGIITLPYILYCFYNCCKECHESCCYILPSQTQNEQHDISIKESDSSEEYSEDFEDYDEKKKVAPFEIEESNV